MKKFIGGCLLFCFGIGMVYYIYSDDAEEAVEVAEATEAEEEQKEEPRRYANVEYRAIAEALRDPAVVEILRLMNLSQVVAPAREIANLLEALEKLETDLRIAQTKSAELKGMAYCAKLPKKLRMKLTTNKPKLPNCKKLGCDGSRADCLQKAIAHLKIILRPFIDDLLLGYETENVHKQGIAFTLIDLAQQPAARKRLEALVEPLQRVMHVLDILEKALQERKVIQVPS